MKQPLTLIVILMISSLCLSSIGHAGIGTRGTGISNAPTPDTLDNMLFQSADLNYASLYQNNGALLKSILLEYLTQNQMTFDTTLRLENQVVNSFADWSSINAQRVLNQVDETNWVLASPDDMIPGPTSYSYEAETHIINISCTETNCQAPLNAKDITSCLAYFMSEVTDAPFSEAQIKQELHSSIDAILRIRGL